MTRHRLAVDKQNDLPAQQTRNGIRAQPLAEVEVLAMLTDPVGDELAGLGRHLRVRQVSRFIDFAPPRNDEGVDFVLKPLHR